MELQWDKTQIPCLRTKVREVQNQEQTLEFRLGDDMPDIGRIICGWGQSVVRGKEWRADGMTISGGIMAWVLYAPEDGSIPRTVEAWLPFSMKWNFPPSDRDGTIRADVKVRGVDARVLSARKMMVRASISALGEALEPETVDVFQPAASEQDVQLLVRTFPVNVPAEAGEKAFLMDEDLQIAGEKPAKIICCDVQPRLTEQKVVGGKAIFRGDCLVHIVYFGEDDRIHSAQMNVPFAQYSDLARDYDKEAGVTAMMAVSSSEAEWKDDILRLKCGLIVQYVILENRLLELAQDAYSTTRHLSVDRQTLDLPVVLDRRCEQSSMTQSVPGEYTNIVDVSSFWEQPFLRRSGFSVDGEMPGVVQVLCLDDGGQYSCLSIRCNHQWSLEAGEDSQINVTVCNFNTPTVSADGTNIHVTAPMEREVLSLAQQQLEMIAGVELGQPLERDSGRPSMILRRTGTDSLWDIAKFYGSTVDAIRKANSLEEAPAQGQMLLIPVS